VTLNDLERRSDRRLALSLQYLRLLNIDFTKQRQIARVLVQTI